jgi:hypothetical protein
MTPDPIVGAELTDGALQDEIELVGELVVAASASEGPLSEAEIDEVLGVTRASREDAHKSGKKVRRAQHA